MANLIDTDCNIDVEKMVESINKLVDTQTSVANTLKSDNPEEMKDFDYKTIHLNYVMIFEEIKKAYEWSYKDINISKGVITKYLSQCLFNCGKYSNSENNSLRHFDRYNPFGFSYNAPVSSQTNLLPNTDAVLAKEGDVRNIKQLLIISDDLFNEINKKLKTDNIIISRDISKIPSNRWLLQSPKMTFNLEIKKVTTDEQTSLDNSDNSKLTDNSEFNSELADNKKISFTLLNNDKTINVDEKVDINKTIDDIKCLAKIQLDDNKPINLDYEFYFTRSEAQKYKEERESFEKINIAQGVITEYMISDFFYNTSRLRKFEDGLQIHTANSNNLIEKSENELIDKNMVDDIKLLLFISDDLLLKLNQKLKFENIKLERKVMKNKKIIWASVYVYLKIERIMPNDEFPRLD